MYVILKTIPKSNFHKISIKYSFEFLSVPSITPQVEYVCKIYVSNSLLFATNDYSLYDRSLSLLNYPNSQFDLTTNYAKNLQKKKPFVYHTNLILINNQFFVDL